MVIKKQLLPTINFGTPVKYSYPNIQIKCVQQEKLSFLASPSMTKAENTSGWVNEPTLARMKRCFTKLALKVKSNSQRIPASVNGWKERLALEKLSTIQLLITLNSFMEWNNRKPLMHLVTKLPDGVGYPKEQLGPRHFLFFHNVWWHCLYID